MKMGKKNKMKMKEKDEDNDEEKGRKNYKHRKTIYIFMKMIKKKRSVFLSYYIQLLSLF